MADLDNFRERDVWAFGLTRGLALLVLGVILTFAAGIGGIVYLRTIGVAHENAKTSVIRQTNQYVTSQQTAMLTLLGDYTALPKDMSADGQRVYIVGQIWNIASTLSDDRIPQEVASFMVVHPRGSK